VNLGDKYDGCIDIKISEEMGSEEAKKALKKHCK
jgi:hypothetical protein